MLLGIDPGKNGGIGLYDHRTADVVGFRMPVLRVPRSDGGCTTKVDAAAALALLQMVSDLFAPAAVILEAVHGYGGQDGAAAFAFGHAAGVIECAAHTVGVPIVAVPPSVWKPRLKVPSDKADACARASELLPAGAHLWPHHTVQDGVAEGALLAYYGAHILGLDGCAGAAPRRSRQRFTGANLAAIG